MYFFKLEKREVFIKFKNFLISLVFSFNIFLWQISFNFIQFRFLILLLILPLIFNFNYRIFKNIMAYSAVTLVFIIHLFIQSEGSISDIYYNLFSVCIFFALLFVLHHYKDFFFENLETIIYSYLVIFFLFLIYQYFSNQDFYNGLESYCLGCFSTLKVFYRENSHFSLLAPSIIFYLFYISRVRFGLRIFLLFLFCVICLTNLSMTFVLGILLLGLLTLLFKVQNFFSIRFILISIIFFTPIFLNKELDRRKITDFFTENDKVNLRTNLSTEVYQVSLYVATRAIREKPFGYGFNNYNEAYNKFISDYDTHNVETKTLNQKDGSINFSKIITEFGILSFFLFYFLFSFFFSKRVDNKVKIFLILPIFIQMFIRGVGYFNGGFILFLYIAFLIWYQKHYKNNLFK